MKRALGKYLRDKLGVTTLQQGMSARLQFLSAYANLMLPEKMEFEDNVLARAKEEISKNYQIGPFKSVIHKNDIMFQHHLRKMPERPGEALWHYFNVGLDALQKIRSIHSDGVSSVLDFGAGYGRGSRFLRDFYPGADITVSDIKVQAMDFQKETFGYETIVHGTESKDFKAGKYDLVLAISVFSHLPRELSGSWIKALFASLNQGGTLVFTFNGTRFAPEGSGEYEYIEQSEDVGMEWVSDRITDSASYGSAFYSSPAISELIQSATGKTAEVIENFSGQQDAIVIRK